MFKSIAMAMVVFVTSFVEAAAPPPIAIQVESNTVTATGLTPGGNCAVIVSWYSSTSGIGIVLETARSARADDAGTVSIQFELRRPPSGLVAVLDVTTGRLAVDIGDGRAFERVDMPSERLKRNDAREVEAVASPQMSVMIVAARPAEGVWMQRTVDGGRGDADGQLNGRIRTDPAAMEPLGDSGPPPRKLKHRDTVLIIDRHAGTYATTEVTP